MLNYIARLLTGAKFVLYEVSRLTWGVPVYAFNWIRCAPYTHYKCITRANIKDKQITQEE